MTINFYKAASLLLEYPSQDLVRHLDVLDEQMAISGDISHKELLTIRQLLTHMKSIPLTDFQAEYVKTFDLTPEHSLHLTHHLFGDDKNRGPALIDLTEMYREYGLTLATNELPDYLPLVLEFASQLEDTEARMFLGDAAKVTNVLAANLEKAESAYAPLIRLIENRGGLARLAA